MNSTFYLVAVLNLHSDDVKAGAERLCVSGKKFRLCIPRCSYTFCQKIIASHTAAPPMPHRSTKTSLFEKLNEHNINIKITSFLMY